MLLDPALDLSDSGLVHVRILSHFELGPAQVLAEGRHKLTEFFTLHSIPKIRVEKIFESILNEVSRLL